MKKTVDIITLGCSKNLVDSETLLGLFEAAGFKCTHDSKSPKGEIAVVNTCGFINDAKEESINTILELAQAKEEGRLKKLYVMGCLSERYRADLEEEIPQVDRYYGKFDYKQLVSDLLSEFGAQSSECRGMIASANAEDNLSNGNHTSELCTQNSALKTSPRVLTTPRHYAYIKISEGCDRHCAYCAIPLITGRHVSRSMDEILDEVRHFVAGGTSEFQIIAQELTYYGIDIDGRQHIAELVERMAAIPGVRWIRLHYAYPTHFPWDLLRVMRENDNVCNYLDIALQHISDNMLTKMKRNVSKAETYELIDRLRREVPGIHLRTTLMVGFPGETEEDFNELVEFVRKARFECMGAFAYSEEDGTYSGDNYTDDVPDEVKERRLSKLMMIQQQISAEIQAGYIGKTLPVIIDRREGDYYIGRTEFSSPEVDPEVLIPAGEKRLLKGHYYNTLITDSEEFDLYGTTMINGI